MVVELMVVAGLMLNNNWQWLVGGGADGGGADGE